MSLNSQTGGFNYYDLGGDMNEEYYGQREVPAHHLENVNIPVSLYWSQNDWLANPAVSSLMGTKSLNDD